MRTTWTLCGLSEVSYDMTCTVGYLFVNNESKNAGNSYCALATYELLSRVYLRSSLKIVKQGFIR